jgi:hypothetical protein
MTKKIQKKQLIHCEEMRDFGKWLRKKHSPTDLIGWYFPVFPKVTRNLFLNRLLAWMFEPTWEVITIDGGYTANSQFEAEVISSLEQIKALLLRRG